MQNNTFSGLIVGQNIVVLERIDSTNNYLKRELAKSTPFSAGTVIMAEDQYAGRGQSDNKWLSEPGQNLTFSFYLTTETIPPELQFDLNIAVSLAINDVLKALIGLNVYIKWPNDVYYKNCKIGGVLIENSLVGRTWKRAIIGIGLNVNQTVFNPELQNVSSLNLILNQTVDKSELLKLLCERLSFRCNHFLSHKETNRQEYIKNLYRFDVPAKFLLNNNVVVGTIKGVDDYGRILILMENELRCFSLKELAYII